MTYSEINTFDTALEFKSYMNSGENNYVLASYRNYLISVTYLGENTGVYYIFKLDAHDMFETWYCNLQLIWRHACREIDRHLGIDVENKGDINYYPDSVILYQSLETDNPDNLDYIKELKARDLNQMCNDVSIAH